MNFTEADLVALKAALISGTMEVQIGDRRVKYRTQAELLAVINLIQSSISTSTDTSSTIQATYSKGSE